MTIKNRLLRQIGHQTWLSGRDRIIRLFSHPDRQKPYLFRTDFFGSLYTGNLQNFIDWTVFYYGSFQKHELLLLRDLAQVLRAKAKPVYFYDVGANIGHHSLFMSNETDHIYCFEPYSVVREELKRKFTNAGAERMVTVFPVALGDKNQRHTFYPPTGANQGTGTLSDELPSNAAAESIEVDVVRGDDFLSAHALPTVSILKLDVEGYEVQALEGMKATLRRDRPPILMEVRVSKTAEIAGALHEVLNELLYPDHVLFGVAELRGDYMLQSFVGRTVEEILVLPLELIGTIRGT